MNIQHRLHLDSRQGRKKPPVFLGLRSAKWFIITTVCIAVFTDIFLYGLIVPVIPFALTKRVGIPKDQSQHWVSVLLAVYGAGLLAASPLFGWFADRTASRRFPLLLGLIALAGSTFMLCFGKSIAVLVLGRLFQGISAAMVWTVGLALLVDTVGQDKIGEVMGYVSIAMALGILVAPILGGVVYDRAGYYSVFAMAFALIAFDVVLRLALVEKKVAVQWVVKKDVESPSEVSQTGEEQAKVPGLAASRNPETSISSRPPSRQGVSRMKKFTSRLPPVITLLSSRRLLAALWGCMIQAALMTAFDSVLPLYVNRIFGFTSTGAGLLFLTVVVPSFIAPLVGWLSDKYGPRWLATAGFVFGAPFYVLLRLVDHDSIKQKVLLCALLTLIGVTLTLVMSPLMAEITYIVDAKAKKKPGLYGPHGAYAQAYGLFNMAFAGGTLVGPIWAGFVEQKAGWGTMSWTLGLLSGLSAIPILIWTGGLIQLKSGKGDAEKTEDRA